MIMIDLERRTLKVIVEVIAEHLQSWNCNIISRLQEVRDGRGNGRRGHGGAPVGSVCIGYKETGLSQSAMSIS